MVHPDTVVRWQRERFRRYWAQRSKKLGRLAQLSEKKIALLRAIAKSEENEFNPAPFVQKFHPQYFKRLGDSGLLIRAGRGRYKLYHPLFRQFLRQQP